MAQRSGLDKIRSSKSQGVTMNRVEYKGRASELQAEALSRENPICNSLPITIDNRHASNVRLLTTIAICKQ